MSWERIIAENHRMVDEHRKRLGKEPWDWRPKQPATTETWLQRLLRNVMADFPKEQWITTRADWRKRIRLARRQGSGPA